MSSIPTVAIGHDMADSMAVACWVRVDLRQPPSDFSTKLTAFISHCSVASDVWRLRSNWLELVSEQICVLDSANWAKLRRLRRFLQTAASLSTANGLGYCYDLAGDLTAYSNGLNSSAFPQQWMLFSQGFDGAARLASVTSSFYGVQQPQALFTANPTSGYAPFGALQNWTYGANLNGTKTFDNRLRVTGETASTP